MLALFAKPFVDKLAHLFGRAAEPLRIAGDETRGTAAIAQLKLFQGADQLLLDGRAHDDRLLPIGLGAVEAIAAEMLDPFRRRPGFISRGAEFTLHHKVYDP